MKINDEIPAGYFRVTEVLSPYTDFSSIAPEILANAADRGSRVHHFCELYARDLLISDIDDDCKNYFYCFKKWFDEFVSEVVSLEERITSDKYKLSGKYDMIVKMKGSDDLVLVDIKTPASISPSWALQTAAYKILLREVKGVIVDRRICLLLPKKGDSASAAEYTQHEKHEQLYLNALELFHFFKK